MVVGRPRRARPPALERLARDRGVELDLRSGIPLPELVALYRRAGVMACAQIREPFGLITLEAMAAAARRSWPCATAASRRRWRDGRTGVLVPRDAAALGAALRRVLDDDALAERLRAAGRAEAETWTWDRTAAGFDARLERAAAEGRRHAAA